MTLPTTTPRKNTVKVVFAKDFQPYEVKAGDIRYVSKTVAERLFSKWKVIDKPDAYIPESKPEPEKDDKKQRYVLVEAVDKSLMAKFGVSWFPHSQHTLDTSEFQYLIDEGLVTLLDNIPPTQAPTQKPTGINPFLWSGWFPSHKEWHGCSLDFAITSVRLAFQCDAEKANEILVEWIKQGSIKNDNGKIVWEN